MSRNVAAAMAMLVPATLLAAGPQGAEQPAAEFQRPDDAESQGKTEVAAPPATLEEALALLDHRPAWPDLPPMNFPVHPAERFLKGMVIVLDPGHGGDQDRPGYKRGPTGVREAEMNWRVARLLEKLLDHAGARVSLTRRGDRDLRLADRAAMANQAVRPDGGQGADLFLSIHHNAGGPEANYTTVWFHGPADNSEPDLDVARYLAHALGRALRTQVAKTSPLMNDRQMYRSGFGVLRHCHVPAVLLECSFFSHPPEEQRLRNGLYNLREAYAIYEGLCEYACGGRPTQAVPTVTYRDGGLQVETVLDDGLPPTWWGSHHSRIIASTIHVSFDNRPMKVQFDPKTRNLVARLDGPPASGKPEGVLEIHFTNFFKHHNWPQRYAIAPPDAPSPLPALRAGAGEP